jgi:glutamyl-Q tRNA(Asp) synthetase
VRLVTDDRPITFEDRLHGRQVQNLSQTTGDFVVFRRDLIYAYHLATVVDDAQQGVTEVVRGTDLLDSTPRQIYLQQCLGFPTPSYMHTPVLLAENGRKLSKQTLAQPADIRSPGRLLSDLLDLLRQNPPPSLKSANPQDVLAWAVDHWKPGALRGITAIPLVAGRAAGPE